MENNKPLVSVIMNCYNGEGYLQEAIDSIYVQTYQNWEVIFWDNASTDNSASIAKSYDERIKYHLASKTTPLGEARNFALKKARGEYIAFLDCDDVWLSDKISSQVRLIASDPNCALVFSLCDVISKGGECIDIIPRKTPPSGYIFNSLIKENFIPFVSVMIDRTKYFDINGFDKKLKNSIDYDLFLRLSNKYKILFINKVLCQYRWHDSNLTRFQYSLGAEENILSLSKFLPNLKVDKALTYHYRDLVILNFREFGIYRSLTVFCKKFSIKLILLLILKVYEKTKRFN